MPAPTINLKLTHAQAVQLSQLLTASAAVAADLCMKAKEASEADAAGNADCGTGSDVPYAAAAMLREHAGEIETLAFAKK